MIGPEPVVEVAVILACHVPRLAELARLAQRDGDRPLSQQYIVVLPSQQVLIPGQRLALLAERLFVLPEAVQVACQIGH